MDHCRRGVGRWLALLACSAAAVVSNAQTQSPVPAAVQKYCIGCHNAKANIGGLALDTIVAEPIGQHAQTWEKVIRKLRARYMPPAGLPRPDEKTYDAVVSSLESSLDAAAA